MTIPQYGLSEAVGLFSQYTAMINNLWAVYAAAAFAAAGYGLSLKSLDRVLSVVITVGFCFFAIGHLRLLWKSMEVQHGLASDISNFLSISPELLFKPSIETLASTAYIQWLSV